jgi:hypothetical protein
MYPAGVNYHSVFPPPAIYNFARLWGGFRKWVTLTQ